MSRARGGFEEDERLNKGAAIGVGGRVILMAEHRNASWDPDSAQYWCNEGDGVYPCSNAPEGSVNSDGSPKA